MLQPSSCDKLKVCVIIIYYTIVAASWCVLNLLAALRVLDSYLPQSAIPQSQSLITDASIEGVFTFSTFC